MTRIGITGHSKLSAASVPLVLKALEDELSTCAAEGLVGVSCLAKGADQLFAQAVLDRGGSLDVVLPAADYRERKVKPDNAAEFDALISKAASVHTMPFATSNPDAYMRASEHVLSSVEAMVAVWDGQPSGGAGGTEDVVRAARERGVPVTVVWPGGAERG